MEAVTDALAAVQKKVLPNLATREPHKHANKYSCQVHLVKSDLLVFPVSS